MARPNHGLLRVARHPGAGAAVAVGLLAYSAAVYAVVVLGGGRLVGRGGSPNLWLSVLATAVVALGFEPVQLRLQRIVARLMRTPASPYEVLRRFADTTRNASSDDLPARMARLLADGTGAAAAEVWLTTGETSTLAASWPPVADDRAAPLPPPVAPSATAGRRSLPVRDGGELLGVLSLRERDGAPLTPVEQRLFAGLAAQAALVLRSARLRADLSGRLAELSERAAELRASRERLIETQDQERRRLERDSHDGAQQHLVALTVNLRLAQTVARRSPERAATLLAAQGTAAQQAIDSLTQLSRGIYPAVLAESGLAAALRSVAGSGPLAVDLAADDAVRLSPEREAALYFCCLEALQNSAKHSGATRAEVHLTRTANGVRLLISDYGRGFDPASVVEGAGMANLRDRIDAVGGTVSVSSSAGAGTRIRIELPDENRAGQ